MKPFAILVAILAAVALSGCKDDKPRVKKPNERVERPVERPVEKPVEQPSVMSEAYEMPPEDAKPSFVEDDTGKVFYRDWDMEKIKDFDAKGVQMSETQADIVTEQIAKDLEAMKDYKEVYAHAPDAKFKAMCAEKAGVVRKIHGGKWVCRHK